MKRPRGFLGIKIFLETAGRFCVFRPVGTTCKAVFCGT